MCSIRKILWPTWTNFSQVGVGYNKTCISEIMYKAGVRWYFLENKHTNSKTRRAGKLSIRKTAPIFKEASSNYALKSQWSSVWVLLWKSQPKLSSH